MGFLKTLIIIVAIWYFLKFAFRFFGPILLRKAVQKAEEKFQQQAQGYYDQNTQDTDTYTTSSDTNMNFDKGIPREKKKVGEYIEFEEIK